MEAIQKQIQEFKISSDEQLELTIQLSGKERSEVHEFVKSNGLYSKTDTRGANKFVKIAKTAFLSNGEVEINERLIESFSHWSGIPIPVTVPSELQYCLDLLSPYHPTKETFQIFMSAVKKEGSGEQFSQKLGEIMETIGSDLQRKLERTEKFVLEGKPKILIKSSVYQHGNENKKFISIDIRKANFTLLQHFYPDLFDGLTWPNYVGKFTDCDFIKQSKIFREVVFGKIGVCRKVLEAAPFFLNKVIDLLKINPDHIISLAGDEMVLSIGDELNATDAHFTYEQIETFRKTLDQEYPNWFAVKVFWLVKIGERPWFVKEHTDGQIEFKCCPKKLMFQCIKKYTGKPIVSNDLKFMDEFGVATFDAPLFSV